eukprot:scaffold173037_cov30-Tisochrysis_lutea.AAC.7
MIRTRHVPYLSPNRIRAGANFDEEYERSIKMIAFQRSSRVVRYQQASRFGTRTPRPPRVYKHWMDHFLPWAEPAPLEPTWDDQEYNIQADVSMLVESHFRLMRTKVRSWCPL